MDYQGIFRVKDVVSKVATEKNISTNKIQKQVITCLSEMRATLSRFICRICGYVLFKVFRRLIKRLLINPAQLVKLKEAEEVCLCLRE